MNKLFFAVLAGLVSGCVTHVVQESKSDYHEGAEIASAKTSKPYVEGATLRPLRVLVSIDGGKDEKSPAYQLSGYLQSHVEGELAACGYRVVYDKPSEVLVSTCGPVTCQLLNKRGSRVVYKGDMDIQVTREALFNKIKGETMKDVIARRRFDMKGGESRSLPDVSDGIKSVADRAAPEVAKWTAESVTRIAGTLERCEFTLVNAWNWRGEEEFPSRLVRTIKAMDGVYQCVVLSTENVRRSVRVEVIYDKDLFPDGFVNALYTVRELNLYR